MKKSFLFGCVAAVALTSTVVSAEPMSAETMKEAFVRFLLAQTQLGRVFDVNQIQVEADGPNFNVTLPEIEKDGAKVPARVIRLTEAGEFNNRPQYRIDSMLEAMQSILGGLVPGSTFSTQSANSNMVWAPDYNLIVSNSQNIKGLIVDLPKVFRITADSLVSDTLVRPTSENKMDKADSQDWKGLAIAFDNMRLTVPSISYSDQAMDCDITGDQLTQALSSGKVSYKLEAPTILLEMPKGEEPTGSLAVKSEGYYQGEAIHFDTTLDHIVLNGALKMLLPTVLTPTEIHVNLDVEGIEKESFKKALTLMQETNNGGENPEKAAEVQKVMQEAMANIVLKINLLEAKNTDAGVALSGVLRNRIGDDGKEIPTGEAKVVFTNLDKISPVPTVNEAQCNRMKEQMEAVSDKEMAERAIQNACAPHGGMLDDIRPYLNPADRVVNTDGTTTDTLTVSFENDTILLNGKELLVGGEQPQ